MNVEKVGQMNVENVNKSLHENNQGKKTDLFTGTVSFAQRKFL
jgi:hypothetical protein